MNKALKEMLSLVSYILIILLCTWLIVTFVGQRTVVDGTSMQPTLLDGEQLIVEKISYRFSDPERFDIVVFPPEFEEDGIYYIKRVIGLPGETVQILQDGTILINGEVLNENYGAEIIDKDHIFRAGEPVVLGDDEYFLMGDNRNNSLDSRSPIVGNIKRDEIIGKAWITLWPLDRFGVVRHQ